MLMNRSVRTCLLAIGITFTSCALPALTASSIDGEFDEYSNFWEGDFKKACQPFVFGKYRYVPRSRYDTLYKKRLVHGIKLFKGSRRIFQLTRDELNNDYMYVVFPVTNVKLSKMSEVFDRQRPLLTGMATRLPAISKPKGEKYPIIIIGYYSGGAHCCYDYLCYSLGDNVRKIEGPESGGSRLTFGYFRGEGTLECIGHDVSYDYWNACHAESPAPQCIYELKNGHWRLAIDQMKVKEFAPQTVAYWIAECKSDMAFAAETKKVPENMFVLTSAVWTVMLDFIYTGQSNSAWKFLDSVWPQDKVAFLDDITVAGKKMDKETFKCAFKEKIRESPVYDGLVLLNQGQEL